MVRPSCAPKSEVFDAGTVDRLLYTEADLLAYAMFIGLDTELDRDLLWIARAGLYAGLPQPWVTCQAEGSNDIFYFNPESGDSVWTHPSDDFYRELLVQTLSERVTVTLTLKAEQSSQEPGFVTLVTTTISGLEVLRLHVSTLEMFADVRQRMTDDLNLPKNVVARFCFEGDWSVLGHSHDSAPLGAIIFLHVVTGVAETGRLSTVSAQGAKGPSVCTVPKGIATTVSTGQCWDWSGIDGLVLRDVCYEFKRSERLHSAKVL